VVFVLPPLSLSLPCEPVHAGVHQYDVGEDQAPQQLEQTEAGRQTCNPHEEKKKWF